MLSCSSSNTITAVEWNVINEYKCLFWMMVPCPPALEDFPFHICFCSVTFECLTPPVGVSYVKHSQGAWHRASPGNHISFKVTLPINISLPQFYVFLCISLLWDSGFGKWGRFGDPLNTVKAGAQRLVGAPLLELQGPPSLPRLLCSPPGRTRLQPVGASEDRMKTNWHWWQMHKSLLKYKSLLLSPTHTESVK